MARIIFPLQDTNKLVYDQRFIEIIDGIARLKKQETEPPVIYPVNSPILKLAKPVKISRCDSIEPEIEFVGNDEIRFKIEINGDPHFYNGENWVVSNNANDTNNLQELQGNFHKLIGQLSSLNILVVFISSDGTTSPSLKSLEIHGSILISETKERNTFCTLDEAQKIMAAFLDNTEGFLDLEELLQEKYLINAFRNITALPYCIDVYQFENIKEPFKTDFKRAQCAQASYLYSPYSEANSLRQEGIFEFHLDEEKMSIHDGLIYSLCPEARKYISPYIDMEIKIL